MKMLISVWIVFLVACSQSENQKRVIVDLSCRGLREIPDSIFENQSITDLDIGCNNLTLYPPLSALSDTGFNQLTELPTKIGDLTNLRTLILSTNKLENFPWEITKLTELEYLDLSYNSDFKIVEEMPKLEQLRKLKTLKVIFVNLSPRDITLLALHLKGTKIVTRLEE